MFLHWRKLSTYNVEFYFNVIYKKGAVISRFRQVAPCFGRANPTIKLLKAQNQSTLIFRQYKIYSKLSSWVQHHVVSLDFSEGILWLSSIHPNLYQNLSSVNIISLALGFVEEYLLFHSSSYCCG